MTGDSAVAERPRDASSRLKILLLLGHVTADGDTVCVK